MPRRFPHYTLLVGIAILLFLPALGRHSLWDVDEAHNAECVREMMEAGDWCVPTFNFRLRTDKPIMLYWVMRVAYLSCGVSEWSARIGSVLCGIGSVLLVYELGRRLFDARTGLLAGIVLASSVLFCVASHAATPDALLIFFTLLTFTFFWSAYLRGSRSWLLTIGISTGLAVLTKGPVGLALPVATIGLFLIRERRLRELWDWRLVGGLLLLAAVVLPWYIYVGVETKWEFWHGFFGKHNFRRFQEPLEGHRGPFFYHPLVMIAGFAPWSIFLGLALWPWRDRASLVDPENAPALPDSSSARRFLWCWLGVWLLFFSAAATKLPNYVLPAYPALALFTAHFLSRWQSGAIAVNGGWLRVAFACFGMIGVGIGVGLLVASGAIPVDAVATRTIPGLAPWAAVGLIPVGVTVWAWRQLRNGGHRPIVWAIAGASVAFIALLAAAAPVVVDAYKAPAALAAEVHAHQIERDIRIGCADVYRPGLVFYTQHEVQWLNDKLAIELLRYPCQTFVIVPAPQWEKIQRELDVPVYIVAARRDFTSGRDMLLITNRVAD